MSIPVNSSLPRATYGGVFNVGFLEASFNVSCNENFIGDDCGKCTPGFMGELCELVDECFGVVCEQNQNCINTNSSYVCECIPGFTGPNCMMDIDDCEGITCGNSGQCFDGQNSFTCECLPSFTGDLCENTVNGYELVVTIESFSNPSHQCAACAALNIDCCDDGCDVGLCDTYLYFCLRPFGSAGTNSTSTMQGECPSRSVRSRTFFNTDVIIFSELESDVTNPTVFRNITNVSTWESVERV